MILARFVKMCSIVFAVLVLVLVCTQVFAAGAATTPKSPTLAVSSSGSDVILGWVSPAANTDGSSPAKIGGFNVYRALNPQIATQQNGGAKPLAGGPGAGISPTTLTYIDKGAAATVSYYAVSAWWCDSAGCSEGDLSNVVSTGGKAGAVASANLSWIAPTSNTDSSPIAPAALTYTVYGGAFGGTFAKVVDGVVATSYVDTGNGPCYAVTATALGNESARSSMVCSLTPSAPTVKLAALGGTAYMELRSKDALVMLPVGTVPGGVSCDPKNAVISAGTAFYLVAVASVTFSGNIKPLAVFASCQ